MGLFQPSEEKILGKVRAIGGLLRTVESITSKYLKKQAATLVVLADQLEELGK